MEKKFRFTIDIVADIPDQLTTEFIKKIIAEVDREHYLTDYFPPIDKGQAFIDYIKDHENIHEECLAGDLFMALSGGCFNEELNALLNPKIFDHIALDIAPELPDKTSDFIIQLYKDIETRDADDVVDVDGNPLAIRNSKKDTLDALKREIDTEIIQQSLLNYKITAASLKILKKK
ncbi:MAG TPA: hypothetical protein VK469_05195 [Candidatus Kapabacteria bacterium]|nr:hypothetical protein [Candidatus Kapabacteria bacterium]